MLLRPIKINGLCVFYRTPLILIIIKNISNDFRQFGVRDTWMIYVI